MGQRHVRQGDSLRSIAAEAGHIDWRAVWEHPNNAELRERRKSPNVLAPGDVVFVPDKSRKQEPIASGQRHRFVVEGTKVTIKLTLRDRKGQALANTDFELVCGGVTRTGTTDGDGRLEVKVSAASRTGTLKIFGENGTEWTFPIAIGHLDPADESSGVRQRLRNLGLLPHASPTEADIEHALRMFQAANGLSETGTVDAATSEKLREKHGS